MRSGEAHSNPNYRLEPIAMLPILKSKLVISGFFGSATLLGLASTARAQCLPIVNEYSGQCMAVTGGNMAPDTPIIEWPCIGTPDQYWELYDAPNANGFLIHNCGSSS